MTKGKKGDSARHLQGMKSAMVRYHGEIKRLVDSANIVCNENSTNEFHCPIGNDCPFRRWHGCKLGDLIDVLGDV